MKQVSVTTMDGIAVVQIDNPPVNALSREVREELPAIVARLADDAAIDAIVVIGAGRTFVAGADIKDLEQAAWSTSVEPPDLHDLLRAVEDAPKPVVMAIHGTALGGGLELAMAGHYRVAVRDARVGSPEANLGIIPGAEGTQRLPRLVGVERAIDMCVHGQAVRGRRRRTSRIDRPASSTATFVDGRRRVCARRRRTAADRTARRASVATSWARRRRTRRCSRRPRAGARRSRPHQTAPLRRRSRRSKRRRRCRSTRAAVASGICHSSACVRTRPGARARVLRRARASRKCPASPKDAASTSDHRRGRHHRRRDDGQRHRHGLRQRRPAASC